MNQKTKILVVGLGGVGGFYGGLLANKYENNEEVEVSFIARGEHLKKITKNGLKVIFDQNEIVGKPYIATDDFSKVGKVDYLIMATKGYDLKPTFEQMKACVGENTVILPLLNGVEAYEDLNSFFDYATVWQGCTYMISRLKEPGVIDNPSGRQKIYFGKEHDLTEQMMAFEKLLVEAGINAIATSDIDKEIWEKYILVSASATATAYYNCSMKDTATLHPQETKELLEEASAIARARNINIDKDIVSVIFDRLKVMAEGATTSMHSDFLAGKESTELSIMTEYMVRQGEKLGIATPMYSKMLASLKNRIGSNYSA